MAKELVTDELWEAIKPLLPEEPEKPKGGRPRIDDRAAFTGILFVLKSGIPWEMLPQEMRCGSGMTCWRRLKEWHEARNGIPLSVTHSAANVYDSKVFEEAVDAIEPIRKPRRGRPRKRPNKLHADKVYDFPRCRQALRKRGITPRIARRGIESSEKLGRYRWVVERTLSWVNRNRRLKVRYERRDDIHQAFLDLGCALICWRYVQRLC
jgi:transposase